MTIARGRHQHLARQQRSLSHGTRPPDDWVVVSMDDPAIGRWRFLDGVEPWVSQMEVDGPLPYATARNRGAHLAGVLGAEVLVFLGPDCLAGPGLVAAYAEAVTADPGTVWSGPVTYLPPGLGEGALSSPWRLDTPPAADPASSWSQSFGMSMGLWERSGGYHEGYAGCGVEDVDYAATLQQRGIPLGRATEAACYHQHHPVPDPPVEHAEELLRNATLFHDRWGWWPARGWLEDLTRLGLLRHEGDQYLLPDGRSPHHMSP